MTESVDIPSPKDAPAFDRVTVRAMLDLFRVDACDFWHNEPNDYGSIGLTLFTGKGSPERFRGEELTGKYLKRGTSNEFETRGTGRYRLKRRQGGACHRADAHARGAAGGH